MTHLPIQGLFAAVATPVRDDGGFDEAAFDRLIDMLVGAGVDGVCIGGATGEYPHFESAARVTVIERAAERLPANKSLLVGIGAASLRKTLEVGKAALGVGSRALLLPMPMFYRYQQDDLRAYAATVSQELAAPCLLYDLPDFTNGIAPETALALMRDEEFIIGIKDSSGRETNLARFAAARDGLDWTLLVGDDRLLALGLQARWDGGISGLACCCPELLVAIVRSARASDPSETSRLLLLLDELIAQIGGLPTPWGIRVALEGRGLATGPLPLPLSPPRRDQIQQVRTWFRNWHREHFGVTSARST